MEVVIDASAIIAVLVHEPQRPAILRATRGVDLIAPASLPWEIGNAFSAMLKQRRISADEALAAARGYTQVPVALVSTALDDALGIAARLQIYAYDAYMLVCALDQRAPLLTLDAGLRQAAPRVGVDVVEV